MISKKWHQITNYISSPQIKTLSPSHSPLFLPPFLAVPSFLLSSILRQLPDWRHLLGNRLRKCSYTPATETQRLLELLSIRFLFFRPNLHHVKRPCYFTYLCSFFLRPPASSVSGLALVGQFWKSTRLHGQHPAGPTAKTVYHHPWTIWVSYADFSLWGQAHEKRQPLELGGIQPHNVWGLGHRRFWTPRFWYHLQFSLCPPCLFWGAGVAWCPQGKYKQW